MALRSLIPPRTPARTHASARRLSGSKGPSETGQRYESFRLQAEKKYTIKTKKRRQKAAMERSLSSEERRKWRWCGRGDFSLELSIRSGKRTSRRIKIDLQSLFAAFTLYAEHYKSIILQRGKKVWEYEQNSFNDSLDILDRFPHSYLWLSLFNGWCWMSSRCSFMSANKKQQKQRQTNRGLKHLRVDCVISENCNLFLWS